ncbi:M20/M25/M40 family metallo-hydrolase [Siccirubricoccus sp. KC 17139]|uniref:M20/M25/M40 family metallo-hydrolase n=1 Tax=Siccirubricoccus soli TaxID=2899147 RepID=A0ABT1D5L4_9PROT|nr:M20/M25/M40 family metallo-hydrolase [Siccirubricoccus soli]MCO6416504.1 M20/M25/M40 family metallo-hydrolase [Siccirubricoccus soli]MCP2682638.1 M20/M25/M40 family metallo-hydrolase [Siccirubricoccus soli]
MSSAADTIARIRAHLRFRAALAVLDREHERTVEDIIRLTEIPAPPFKEAARASAYLEMLRAHGLEEVEQDAVGNVMGRRRGSGNGQTVVVAAHLDTVFPEGTDVRVRREGTKLFAPGVGDDTRSLAVNLAFLRALDEAGIVTRCDLLFLGDVGEEGLGDLRGVRHFFREGRHRDRVAAFFTVDSPEVDRIVTGGVGSKRFRVTFCGPGGHSFGAFGLVNPAYAMARASLALAGLAAPDAPKTTHCVSVLGGGTSVNAIPNAVWMEVDLRSESAAELARLEREFLAGVEAAVAAENAARSTREGAVTVEIAPIGDRPAGATPESAPIAQFAAAAVAAEGYTPVFESSSTDANIPMSLGIPALRIGSGGRGGRAHSLEEWIDVEKGESLRGMAASLATILAVAGFEE